MKWLATIDQFSRNIVKITPPSGEYTVYMQRPDQESTQDTNDEIWRISIYILDVRLKGFLFLKYNKKLTKLVE